MSSRLFQKIREEQGLVYSIYSDLNPYRDTGCMAIYAGTSVESTRSVVESVLTELRELKSKPLPEEEVRRAKDQLKGSLMLSLESSTSRMSNLARQEMYFEHFFTLDETINMIEAVSSEELYEMSNHLFQTDRIAVTALGNLDGLKLSRDQLVC
jgi:predicted Zn-dependent peptidase